MPSTYAHYRFGTEVIKTLNKDAQLAIARFRPLFDVGLHGPDIFFHYNIFFHTATGELANTMHLESGQEFFQKACKRQRMHPSEAGMAYLYGFLAHYALDSLCHPFIYSIVSQGEIGHVELESEFDRFLLDVDHRNPPHRQDLGKHLHLSRSEAATAAYLLSDVSAGAVRRSVRNMALHSHLLATVKPELQKKVLSHMGRDIADQLMPQEPNRNCAYLDGDLHRLYKQALALYPGLAAQMEDHILNRTPLGEDFQKPFDVGEEDHET